MVSAYGDCVRRVLQGEGAGSEEAEHIAAQLEHHGERVVRRYLYLSLSLSPSLSIHIYIYIICTCICLCIYLSIYLSNYVTVYLSIYLSIYLRRAREPRTRAEVFSDAETKDWFVQTLVPYDMYLYMYLSLSICIYIYTYMCVCIYIYI